MGLTTSSLPLPEYEHLDSPHAGSKPSFTVVILSANPENSIACVNSILKNEPELDRRQVFLVDDGARALAETRLEGVQWIEGQRPFVFARNVNRGIGAAEGDIILMHDDAELVSPGGFSRLARLMGTRRDVGVASAAIRGMIGHNPRQGLRAGGGLRIENSETLGFFCVFLPRQVIRSVGIFDERFTGFGYEDGDYSLRIRREGLSLAVFDGCVVEHSVNLQTTSVKHENYFPLFLSNEQLFYKMYHPKVPVHRPDMDKARAIKRVTPPAGMKPSNVAGHPRGPGMTTRRWVRSILARQLVL